MANQEDNREQNTVNFYRPNVGPTLPKDCEFGMNINAEVNSDLIDQPLNKRGDKSDHQAQRYDQIWTIGAVKIFCQRPSDGSSVQALRHLTTPHVCSLRFEEHFAPSINNGDHNDYGRSVKCQRYRPECSKSGTVINSNTCVFSVVSMTQDR